ncbi:MAG: DUF1467 family protein [Alphaproteobacteria bacterium]
MTWFTGLMVYVILWFLVLFMVLPFGVKAPDEVKKGHASGAPANPRILLKFGLTTLVAAALWGIVYLIVAADWITFRTA